MAEEKNLNLDEMYIAIGYGLNCDVRMGGIEVKGMESLVHSPMPRKNVVAELKKNITDCITNLDGYLAIRVTSHTADNNNCVSFIITDENPHQEDIELLFKRLEDGDADVVEIKPDDCTPNVYLLPPVVDNYNFADGNHGYIPRDLDEAREQLRCALETLSDEDDSAIKLDLRDIQLEVQKVARKMFCADNLVVSSPELSQNGTEDLRERTGNKQAENLIVEVSREERNEDGLYEWRTLFYVDFYGYENEYGKHIVEEIAINRD
jgi:hypothetical protein